MGNTITVYIYMYIYAAIDAILSIKYLSKLMHGKYHQLFQNFPPSFSLVLKLSTQ